MRKRPIFSSRVFSRVASLIIGVVCLTFFPCLGYAHTLHVTEDADISGSIHGESSKIKVDSGHSGFVKFDLSTLPSGTTGGDVAKATLRMFVSKVSSPGILDLHLANGPWDEHGSVGVPTPGVGPFATLAIANDDEKHFVTVDVTDVVSDWLDGVENNGIAILPSLSSSSQCSL